MGGLFDDDDAFGRPVENTEFVRLETITGHLLIVFPLGYIEHSPTRFSQPGKKSDAIACDIIDLDELDEAGVPGKIYRNTWWRGAQLIMSLRPQVGKPVLGRIGHGVAKNGMNAPWVINDMAGDPALVARAQEWGRTHTDFVKSTFQQPLSHDVAGFPPGAASTPPRFPVAQQGPQQSTYPQGQNGYGQQQGYAQAPPAPAYSQPQQQGYPPQQQGYPPQQQGYPSQQQGYPPQPGGYSPPAPVQSGEGDLDMLELMRRNRNQPQGYGQPENPPF